MYVRMSVLFIDAMRSFMHENYLLLMLMLLFMQKAKQNKLFSLIDARHFNVCIVINVCCCFHFFSANILLLPLFSYFLYYFFSVFWSFGVLLFSCVFCYSVNNLLPYNVWAPEYLSEVFAPKPYFFFFLGFFFMLRINVKLFIIGYKKKQYHFTSICCEHYCQAQICMLAS